MFTDVSIAVVVVSDTCAENPIADKTGPALLEAIDASTIAGVVTVKHVADNTDDIQAVLRVLISGKYNAIFTAGGTGFGKRDVTPEAVKPLLEKEASGIVAAMLNTSLRITPYAALSRPVAGVAGSSLIVTFPGSPKGAVENFRSIVNILPHASQLINGQSSRELHAASAPQNGASDKSSTNELPELIPVEKHKTDTALHHAHTHSHHLHGHDHHDHDHRNVHDNESSHDANSHSHSHSHNHSHSHTHSHSHSGPKFFGPAFRDRVSPYPLVPFDEAVQTVIDSAPEPILTEVVLEEAIGHVLSRNIIAPVNVPSFRASMVDGYAVVHSDFDGEHELVLPVSKVSHASSDLDVSPPRTCARITTGAPVPHGATAVVPVENTEVNEEHDGEEISVRIVAQNIKSGDNIRKIGSDISIGTSILPQNTVISSLGGEIGVLASLGINRVPVYKRPKVGVLSTGDEVVDAGEALSGSQIWDSNRPMSIANLQSWLGHHNVSDLGIAKDNMESLTETVRAASEKVDVLVTSGGVSMGESDSSKPSVKNLGGVIKFGRVLMKPGKPVTFAVLPSNKIIIALPGNPVSCVVCLQLFGYPLSMKMSGRSGEYNEWVDVKSNREVKLDSRPEFQRGIAVHEKDGDWHWDSTGFQRSSCIKSMVRANALLRLPAASADVKILPAGATVRALFLGMSKIN